MIGISLQVTESTVPRASTNGRSTRLPNVALHVALFQARNVVRSRWIVAYAAFFLLATEGLLRFSGNLAGSILSLASIVLYVVPLVTLVVGSVYLYSAREFIELLLSQPINRRRLFAGLYAGLAGPLAASICAGISIPFLVRGFASGDGVLLLMLLAIGTALTFSFAGIALALALYCDDRLRGLTAAIGLWLLGAVLYDAGILAIVAAFSDYPLERPMLAMTLFNPIDLARVAIMLQLDVSALMGYTGALFQQFLGGTVGLAVAASCLAAWVIIPAAIGARMFSRKDF